MNALYRRTLLASYIGYITQAIINNLAPLLFVIFQQEFHISVGQIGFLVTYNFGVQILVDFLSAGFVSKIGYKPCIVAAHIFSAAGLVGLGVLPSVLANPYVGLLLAVTIYAIGGGLIEVLVSPIVEALPLGEKSGAMSLLHSFYCWGHALVVILSTVFFWLAGTENWRMLTVLWAVIPCLNAALYAFSPICILPGDESPMPMKKLFSMKVFWLFVVLMICSGASEQSMSQWASFFAEKGLLVSKTMGDLLGPCMFAVLMGISRVIYSAYSHKLPLKKVIMISGVLCVISYLIAVFSPLPIISLLGGGLCGLSVGIMWPGVFSLSAEICPQGGTAMFALLALAGDVGCASGPALVGTVSEGLGGELKAGLLAAILFPTILVVGLQILRNKK